ncbi:hypothetical protein EDC96DRAFT_521501 [Choanephora cucurbitarum]|nr:hypothetical protein EDC96DRAFT_521501 [Choanephora cucurbitarum]
MTLLEKPLRNSPSIDYVCHNCQKNCVRGDPSLIRAVGQLYHKDCFKCDFCQISVLDKFYLLDIDVGEAISSNIILCEKDYYQQSQFKCHQCNGQISNDHFQMIGSHKYHQQCLFCPGCTIENNNTCKTDEERFDYNGRPYCRYHYSLIKGTECVGCGQAVLDQSKIQDQVKWHTECYMIKKYYQVDLIDIRSKFIHESYSKGEFLAAQDEHASLRLSIWRDLSQFEDKTAKLTSDTILSNQSGNVADEYYQCHLLTKQISTIFTVMDLLFKHVTHLSYDTPIQELKECYVSFVNMLCQSNLNETEIIIEMATKMSQHLRDLIKLILQQSLILERNFGPGNNVIPQVLCIFSEGQHKTILDISYLHEVHQFIQAALLKMGFVLNIKPTDNNRPDETISYKAPTININTSKPTFSSIYNQTKMTSSTTHLQYLPKQPQNTAAIHLNRSQSTSRSTTEEKSASTTPSRMRSIRRALTTTRRKESKDRGSSAHPPLQISLPDTQLNHTTPPLSPPSAPHSSGVAWVIPTYIPEITQQQDSIVRHTAALYIESHVDDYLLVDDLLAFVDAKKLNGGTSLWGKLKTHILTPTSDASMQFSLPSPVSEKKIGVSLCNLSNASLSSQQKISDSAMFEKWKTACPFILPCFSSHSLVPSFLRDCILVMVDQDINTEGIFRKNGNIRGLKDMCDTLDSQAHREDWKEFFKEQTIVQLAAFIKRFLRELPEPLMTHKMHKLFMLSTKVSTQAEMLAIIRCSICILPKPNRDTLLMILVLLNWVARHADENKMDYENLATVMAPNILYKNHETKKTSHVPADPAICHGEICVISAMIEHVDKLIEVPSEFSLLLEHPKMTEYLYSNSIDLTSSKHFVRTFSNLIKIKKEIGIQKTIHSHTMLPPSPSISAKY